jgi:hypothetical protein
LIYEFSLAITETAPIYKIGKSGSLPGSFPINAAKLIANDPTALQTAYVQANPLRNYVRTGI